MKCVLFDKAVLYHGECRDILPEISGVHACVTDPPYGLSFMGKRWDHRVPGIEFWTAVMGSCLPGAHLLAFGGTRTVHRLVCAIEDAGWEIRDGIEYLFWVYGSGFPKSLDISKALDKAAGFHKENHSSFLDCTKENDPTNDCDWRKPSPATEAAKQWQGFGTALKPAHEPICLARKPLDGTVAQNVLTHGCGGLNIDGCRVAHNEQCRMMAASRANIDKPSDKCRQAGRREPVLELKPAGRFPANLIHDGSPEVVGLFPESKSTGGCGDRSMGALGKTKYGKYSLDRLGANAGGLGDSGSAARFFYCAKASKADRGDGNNHPTVKPTSLMRYLCRLVTPPGGVVLDPFMGSGSTGVAALRGGFGFIGIEKDKHAFDIARKRISRILREQRRMLI